MWRKIGKGRRISEATEHEGHYFGDLTIDRHSNIPSVLIDNVWHSMISVNL